MKNSGLKWFCFWNAWCLLVLVGPCFSSEEGVLTVDVHAANGLFASSGHRYLDVRTREEFRDGHLENSLNIPYMFFTPQGRLKNPEFVEQVSSVCNEDDLLVVGCQSGVRSLQASVDLLNAGFKNVKNMGGGYAAWVDNGFAVKKPKPELKNSVEPKPEAAASVDVHAAKGLMDSGHCYLDVRTTEEFRKGHLEKSLNIPYMFFTPQGRVKNKEFVKQVSLVCKKEDRILVGCQSGVRSLEATTDLLSAGFENAQNVKGGYAAWVENGFFVKQLEEEL